MKNKTLKLCAALGLLAMTNTASAAFINGDISFYGWTTATTNADAITAIDFWNDSATVVENTGSFADTGWNFASFNDLTTIAPTQELWSFGDFSFKLLEINENYLTEDGGVLSGTGIVSAEGYDDTVYSWTYDLNSWFDIGNKEIGSYFAASAVPAPAGVALLGFALFGFGATRRNKKA